MSVTVRGEMKHLTVRGWGLEMAGRTKEGDNKEQQK